MRSGSGWQRLGGRAISRRRAVVAFAGGAGAAAFLAACGGDKKESTGGTPAAGGQAPAGTQAAQEQPRPGGVVTQRLSTDPPSLDIHQVTTFTGVWPCAPCMNQLVQFDPDKPGDRPEDI